MNNLQQHQSYAERRPARTYTGIRQGDLRSLPRRIALVPRPEAPAPVAQPVETASAVAMPVLSLPCVEPEIVALAISHREPLESQTPDLTVPATEDSPEEAVELLDEDVTLEDFEAVVDELRNIDTVDIEAEVAEPAAQLPAVDPEIAEEPVSDARVPFLSVLLASTARRSRTAEIEEAIQPVPPPMPSRRSAALPPAISRGWEWLRKNQKFSARKQLRVSDTVALGEKRFVALLHFEGRKFLIGGGASNVSLLTELGDASTPSMAIQPTIPSRSAE